MEEKSEIIYKDGNESRVIIEDDDEIKTISKTTRVLRIYNKLLNGKGLINLKKLITLV